MTTILSVMSGISRKKKTENLFTRMYVTLRVLNSKYMRINVRKSKISPTLHKVVAHGWEVMELHNMRRGLGSYGIT